MIPLTSLLLLSSLLSLLLTLSVSSQVSISLSPESLSKSGDQVTIRWSGVESPSKRDWLGIYSPPSSPHSHFIGYFFLSDSQEWHSGSGSLTFPLINLRSNYTFRIFRWTDAEVDPSRHDHDQNPLPGTKHLLAESNELGFGYVGPEQVHLALTGQEHEMRVMYVTHDGKESFVKYGLGPDQMNRIVATQVGRYEREDMCDSPANHSVGWRDPGYIHDGVMTNLKKGNKYYYKVGSDSGGWSVTYSFMSHDGDSDETVAFLFGDMGTATPYNTFVHTPQESISTMKWISRDIEALGDKPALVSHIGDISYARGYSWLWDNFFAQIEPVASKVPYHVCIGNHEYNWPLQPWRPEWSYAIFGRDGGGECGVPYSLRFNMPGNFSEPTGTHAPATQNLYYSFDVGVVHFVYISTETNFLPGSSQYDFIKNDLESVDRVKTPFVVVQGHRPMYTTSYQLRDTPLRNRMLEHLEPLLVKNKVTLALWGHIHSYERFCPLNNFTCGNLDLNREDWKAFPVHVVIGMGGHDWQPIWEPRADHPDLPIFPQPVRSLFRVDEWGYTRLVASKEKLTLSYVGNHDGEVHDMVEILVSGQVLNGGGSSSAGGGAKPMGERESRLSWFVKGAAILVLGAFVGCVLGFVLRARRDTAAGKNWTPVKNEAL